MSFDDLGLAYLMLIPLVFASIVTGQGIYKIKREEHDGGLVLTFGLIFLLLVILGWWFFIR